MAVRDFMDEKEIKRLKTEETTADSSQSH